MFQALRRAIFVGDREWAWRRRATLASIAVMLACIIHAVFFEPDTARMEKILSNCGTWLLGILGLYIGGAVADDKFRRDTAQKAAP